MSASNVQAVVRVRPLLPHEYRRGDQVLVECLDDNATIQIFEDEQEAEARRNTIHAKFNASKQDLRADHRTSMRFDSCFGAQASTEEVFSRGGIRNVVESVCQGYAATVFAYGQTGAGKTFSLLGADSNKLRTDRSGIISLAVKHILERTGSAIHLTFSEIYAERVYDLLDVGSTPTPLRVRNGQSNSFYVEGLSERVADDLAGVAAVVDQGLSNARVGSHALNSESNRSHRMLTIHVNTEDENGSPRYGKLVLVDLAGSEDVRTTGSSGTMLKEASNINKSLFCLGKVISTMSRKAQKRNGGSGLIPYRDSTLTKLLADSLGGSSHCLILACVSPSSKHTEETQRTLAFACRARSIKNEPVVVMDPQDKLIADLKAEIQMLRTENATLKQTNHGVEPGESASSWDGEATTSSMGQPMQLIHRSNFECVEPSIPSPGENPTNPKADSMARSVDRPAISSLLQDFNPNAYNLDYNHVAESSPTRAMSPYSALQQLAPSEARRESRRQQPKKSATNPVLAQQRRTLPASAPMAATSAAYGTKGKKAATRRGRAVNKTSKPRSASVRRQRKSKPSEWAQALVANVASDWGSKLHATEHVALDAGAGDPKAFDDWESRMLKNWEAAYQEVVQDFGPDATPKVARRKKRPPHLQVEKKAEQYGRYNEADKGVGGGWNSSVDLNESSKKSNSNTDIFDPDAQLRKMKKEILLQQLEHQRNLEETKKNKLYAQNKQNFGLNR